MFASQSKTKLSSKLFLLVQALMLAVLVVGSFNPDAMAAMTLEGGISKDESDVLEAKEAFLTEVAERYPCWENVCRQTLTWNKENLRRKAWFEATFFGRMSVNTKRKVELLAESYGIDL